MVYTVEQNKKHQKYAKAKTMSDGKLQQTDAHWHAPLTEQQSLY